MSTNTNPSPPVWFITGCSRGLGLALTLFCLRSQHRVIATSRSSNPSLIQQIESLGGHWLQLDVTSPESRSSAISSAFSIYGRIDVLVNNAGYSILGAIEDISEKEAREQLETCFWGPAMLTKTVLPGMRERRGGTIVMVSSVAGMDGLATCGFYAASKFAIEGFSESLQREMESFGVNVLVVEPGAFKTGFLTSAGKKHPENGMSEPYRGTAVEKLLRAFDEMDGNQIGDAEEGAKRIFEAVTGTGVVGENMRGKGHLRLVIGSDAGKRIAAKAENIKRNLEDLGEVIGSTDIEH